MSPSRDEHVDVHLTSERGERVVVCWGDDLLTSEDADAEGGRVREGKGKRVMDVLGRRKHREEK